MLKSIVNLVFCLSTISVFAQPTISGISWGNANFRERYFISTQNLNPNPVPTGNGVIWDFTNLTSDPADSMIFVNMGGNSAFKFDFPQCNVTFAENYAKTNETIIRHYYRGLYEFSYLGAGLLGMGSEPYGSSETIFKFPMAFNTSFKAFYSVGSTSGYVIVKYDGYGTLKLPGKTYTNVYRTTVKDSISPSSITYRYEWFNDMNRIMYMNVGTTTTINYLNNPVKSSVVNHLQNSQFSVELFPNPSNGCFHVRLPESVTDGFIEVTNSLGQVVISKNAGMQDFDFLLETKGLYFISVISGNQKYSQKLIVD